MKFSSFSNRIAGLIGNLLEQYDNALFGLTAPFIAPIFFCDRDPVTALILTYALFPLGLIAKPLGSIYFGRLGDRLGRNRALFYSLFGMATVTTGLGVLPGCRAIGTWAPILLAVGRMFQNFFSAGESAGGAIFVLENTPESKKGFFGSLYDLSSMGGILLASAGIAFLGSRGTIQESWRMLFLFGGFTGAFGVLLRLTGVEEKKPPGSEKPLRTPLFQTVKEHRTALFSIASGAGFSHVTYSLTFPFMNGFLPLVTDADTGWTTALHTKLLTADLLLLPLFGYLSCTIGKERMMLVGSIGSAVLGIPLFGLLNGCSAETAVFVRTGIMILGICFAAPYYAWAFERAPQQHRYFIFALGSTIGSQLLGAPSSAICLWLYRATGLTTAPGVYLLVSGILASSVIIARLSEKRTVHGNRSPP